MKDRDKQLMYFIERFRTVGKTSSRVGILFVFTLLYVFGNSVIPNINAVKLYIRLSAEADYFENVLKQYSKKIVLLNEDIDRIKLNKGSENDYTNGVVNKSDRISDQIKELDTLRVRAKERKKNADSEKQKLLNSKFSFSVPTLDKVELNPLLGFLFWMILCSIFLMYFYYARLDLINYFNRIIIITDELKESINLNEYDLQAPFWFAPLYTVQKKSLEHQTILGRKENNSSNIALFLFILIIILLQVYVCWVCINYIYYFEQDTVFVVTLFLLSILASTITYSLKWLLNPYVLGKYETIKEENERKLSRRKYLIFSTYSIAAIVTIWKIRLIQFPQIDYSFKKKLKVKNNSPKLTSGFYINKEKWVLKKPICVHYLDRNGIFPTLQHEKKERYEKAVSKLKKIEVEELINFINDKTNTISFPNASSAIEETAYYLNKNGKIYLSLKLLLAGVRFYLSDERSERLFRIFLYVFDKKANQISKSVDELKKEYDSLILKEDSGNWLSMTEEAYLKKKGIFKRHELFYFKQNAPSAGKW